MCGLYVVTASNGSAAGGSIRFPAGESWIGGYFAASSQQAPEELGKDGLARRDIAWSRLPPMIEGK